MFVWHRFVLSQKTIEALKRLPDPFEGNDFGLIVFYRTYSRIKEDNTQESWLDVVVRNINGCFSILKDWYIKNHISWEESYWQSYAHGMTIAMYSQRWMPPGRGLWAMGTQFMYEEGSMCLNNCGVCTIGDNISNGIAWLMDSLMLGVGVGFKPLRNDSFETYLPKGYYNHTIRDSREGWVESVRLLINAYIKPNQKEPRFDYESIRPPFTLIKRFGGVCMGSESLKILHDQIKYFFIKYYNWFHKLTDEYYDIVMLKTDLANVTGYCVISGNVRRSAEIAMESIQDTVFMDLKQYENPRYAYRQQWGGMSNNTVYLEEDEDYNKLGEVAERVKIRAEPGVANLRNFPYGRIGKRDKLRKDKANAVNPCGEQTLETPIDPIEGGGGEVCDLADTVPTNCTKEEWLNACEYAATYAYIVTLLPTHQPDTNKIIARNRRIGVGIIDWIGWKHKIATHECIRLMRKGYKRIRKTVKKLSEDCGTPESIKITTVSNLAA